MNNSFQERLTAVLGGRKPHAWSESVGWNRGLVDRVFRQGTFPGPEYLERIALIENVNLDWLITGRGQPYRIRSFIRDSDIADTLTRHLETQAWQPYLIQGGIQSALALTLETAYPDTALELNFVRVEIFVGPIGNATLNALEIRRPGRPECRSVTISADEMHALQAGEIGSWQLLKPNGLLAAPALSHIEHIEAFKAAEESENYLVMTAAEHKLLSEFRMLEPSQQEVAGRVISSFAEQNRKP